MILVIDSGATKAHWKSNNGLDIITRGISPYYQTTESIIQIIEKKLLTKVNIHPKEIYFYAPGCKTANEKAIVKDALIHCFPHSKIEIDNDLIAAARAIYGNKSGIAAILGTGSSSSVYDGQKFTDKVASLGIIMGDEGSGAYKGKLLLQHYFYRKMDDELKADFEQEYPEVTDENFILSVYKTKTASKFLGKFTPFLSKHRNHSLCQKILNDSFQAFYKAHLIHYKSDKIGFVGSIAAVFKEELNTVLTNNGLQLTKIIQAPIDELVQFHSKQV